MAALAADLYLHHRAERSAGLNRWGYRGPVAGTKQPGELRVVVLGGSTAFGYGVRWDEAIPAILERKLNQQQGKAPARVVNLGFNNEGAYSFLPTLKDFEYLDYDVRLFVRGLQRSQRRLDSESSRLPSRVSRLPADRLFSDSSPRAPREGAAAALRRRLESGVCRSARHHSRQDRVSSESRGPHLGDRAGSGRSGVEVARPPARSAVGREAASGTGARAKPGAPSPGPITARRSTPPLDTRSTTARRSRSSRSHSKTRTPAPNATPSSNRRWWR